MSCVMLHLQDPKLYSFVVTSVDYQDESLREYRCIVASEPLRDQWILAVRQSIQSFRSLFLTEELSEVDEQCLLSLKSTVEPGMEHSTSQSSETNCAPVLESRQCLKLYPKTQYGGLRLKCALFIIRKHLAYNNVHSLLNEDLKQTLTFLSRTRLFLLLLIPEEIVLCYIRLAKMGCT